MIKSKLNYKELCRYTFVTNYLWMGMILGISFLEAWVKFQAPSLTREIGLDVGRHVFNAFNKVEIGLWLINILFIGTTKKSQFYLKVFAFLTMAFSMQTLYILPELHQRAAVIIAGGALAPSHAHTLYALLEVAKFVLLFVLAWTQLKMYVQQEKEKPIV